MLHDFSFLNEKSIFPPSSELERLKTYEDNENLFNQNISDVLSAHEARIRDIDRKFAELDWASYTGNHYELDLNYFQLIALKNADMICGEPPTITFRKKQEIKLPEPPPEPQYDENGEEIIPDDAQSEFEQEYKDALKQQAEQKQNENLENVIDHTELYKKLQSVAVGCSYAGDIPVRVYLDDEGKNNFTLISPSMWYPIIDREIKEKVIAHVLAWVVCVDVDREKYQLNVQIHEKGFYTNCLYDINGVPQKVSSVGKDSLLVNMRRYEIGRLISKSEPISTGLDDFAIVVFQNLVPPTSIYAINDYDRVTPILAELNVRYTLEGLILDKHSAPTLAVPPSALVQNRQGEWTAAVGGVIRVQRDEIAPSYITWDASLQANHLMIEKLEKHLYSLSEMGAVLNDDAFGASQGFEALETRMTNARLKARRSASNFTRPLKKLISLLSQIGYERIESAELSVQWNDGLPNNEYRETDIALRKVGNKAIFDRDTVLKEHYGRTQEEADLIVQKLKDEEGGGFAGQYASLLGMNNQAEDVVDEGNE